MNDTQSWEVRGATHLDQRRLTGPCAPLAVSEYSNWAGPSRISTGCGNRACGAKPAFISSTQNEMTGRGQARQRQTPDVTIRTSLLRLPRTPGLCEPVFGLRSQEESEKGRTVWLSTSVAVLHGSFVPVQCPLVAAAFAENGIDELLELRAWRMLASTQGQGGK